MKRTRSPTAPAVPQMRAFHCWSDGSERTARAMTRALSPASDRSMRTMARRRAQNSGSRRKMVGSIPGLRGGHSVWAAYARGAPRQPPPHGEQRHGEDQGDSIAQDPSRMPHPALHSRVLEKHLARHPPEQRASGPDDPGEAIHQTSEMAAAPDHDGNGHRDPDHDEEDRKSTRLNSSHLGISYAVFCLKKKKKNTKTTQKSKYKSDQAKDRQTNQDLDQKIVSDQKPKQEVTKNQCIQPNTGRIGNNSTR